MPALAPTAALAATLLLSPWPLDFRHYQDVPELESSLRELAARHPDKARLTSMGKSYEGRDLFVLTIENPKTGPAAEKAAIYIDGNTHGNEIQGAEICLYTAHLLLTEYGRDPYVTRVVDERVFHIAPTVNPDGRAAFFRDPQNPHSSRGNRRPFDDDGDGLADEDPPNDLDGDGKILMMRKRDPNGDWVSGTDPRELVPRRPDQPGEWTVWFSEGIDDDGDGQINEDPPGGVDLNRNFPASWAPRYVQGGAGDYPLSEPETRATAAFVLAHPQIAAIQSYHNFGDMILRPPASRGDEGLPGRDLAMYDALGRRGEKLLPGYRYLQTARQLYSLHGGFLEWGYMNLGVYTFTNEIWSMPADYDGNGAVSEAERLRWNDEALDGRGFVPWHPFKHPTLGEIEIGGWDPRALRITPTWLLEETCARNARFSLYHADMMPRVGVGAVRVAPAGGGAAPDVWRVEATLENSGFMDTVTELGRALKVSAPDTASIAGPAARAVAAAEAEDRFADRFLPVPRERARDPGRVELAAINGRSAVRIAWLVKGSGDATIELRSEKGGRARKALRLEVR